MIGWTYEGDQSAISDALSKVRELENTRNQKNIQYQIDLLNQQNKILNDISENNELASLYEIFANESNGFAALYDKVSNIIDNFPEVSKRIIKDLIQNQQKEKIKEASDSQMKELKEASKNLKNSYNYYMKTLEGDNLGEQYAAYKVYQSHLNTYNSTLSKTLGDNDFSTMMAMDSEFAYNVNTMVANSKEYLEAPVTLSTFEIGSVAPGYGPTYNSNVENPSVNLLVDFEGASEATDRNIKAKYVQLPGDIMGMYEGEISELPEYTIFYDPDLYKFYFLDGAGVIRNIQILGENGEVYETVDKYLPRNYNIFDDSVAEHPVAFGGSVGELIYSGMNTREVVFFSLNGKSIDGVRENYQDARVQSGNELYYRVPRTALTAFESEILSKTARDDFAYFKEGTNTQYNFINDTLMISEGSPIYILPKFPSPKSKDTMPTPMPKMSPDEIDKLGIKPFEHAEGTLNSEFGPALVNERGSELIVTPDGSIVFLPSKDNKTDILTDKIEELSRISGDLAESLREMYNLRNENIIDNSSYIPELEIDLDADRYFTVDTFFEKIHENIDEHK